MEGKRRPFLRHGIEAYPIRANLETAYWVSFAADPSAAPHDNLGHVWPEYTGNSGDVVVFGNATGPSASYVGPAAAANQYSGC
jgi:hypothetical protein